jgi:hypothetical protein
MEELDKKAQRRRGTKIKGGGGAKVAEDWTLKHSGRHWSQNQRPIEKQSGLTPKEQSEKAVLRKEFYRAFNDVTRVATLIADPKFRRYLACFKTAKVILFSNEILSNLGGKKKHLPELLRRLPQLNSKNERV